MALHGYNAMVHVVPKVATNAALEAQYASVAKEV